MMNLLRGRDSGQKYLNSSLYNHHYAPHKKPKRRLDAREGGAQALRAESPSQNYIIFDSLPRLLATILLSPAGSWKP